MKRVFLGVLCLVGACTLPRKISLAHLPISKPGPDEQVVKFWYSQTEDIKLMLEALEGKSVYVRKYVNNTQFTGIADTATYNDAILIAVLPWSQVFITVKPCPCPMKPIPVRVL